ncbi:hypothetical protein EUAN_13600 [Andreesenia angusta]|uniref:Uncharacterized protein n=1 Tax=Andreesenia angusta TaxID=39480 RepID=A0A1S1V7C0_9FIRM|nr:hypothetical protein [Andreesenia angusta]OHW62290.1 hypothetical protein EUAN_13600 [Andreesenia angusta]
MEKTIIKTHNFESSKNKIKAFSRQTPTTPELKKVNISGGPFGWGDHKVTGYELNSLTTQIQDYFKDFNSLHIKLVQEFGEVYNALEALDEDYIKGILIAIKGVEKTSDEVKVAQNDIAQTIEVQKKMINVLNQFKTKIESYEHLGDIDKLWHGLQKSQKHVDTISNNISSAIKTIENNAQEINELNKFRDQIEKIKQLKNLDELWNNYLYLKKEFPALGERIDGTSKQLESQLKILDNLTIFKNEIEGYEHIRDIDQLWTDSMKVRKDIESINKEILDINSVAEIQIQEVEALTQFNSILKGYKHLKDVDETWNKCNELEVDVSSSKEIIIQHENQINDLINSLEDIRKQSDERNQTFSKKLKLAYVLAGSSIAIAAVEFAFLMQGGL